MGDSTKGDMSKVAARRKAPLETPTDLKSNAVRDVSAALNFAARRHLRALRQDQELPLAHVAGRTSATTTCCSTSRPTRSSP